MGPGSWVRTGVRMTTRHVEEEAAAEEELLKVSQ